MVVDRAGVELRLLLVQVALIQVGASLVVGLIQAVQVGEAERLEDLEISVAAEVAVAAVRIVA